MYIRILIFWRLFLAFHKITAEKPADSHHLGFHRVFGKIGPLGSQVWRNWRSYVFPLVKTEERRQAKDMKLKCEDWVLKCEDSNVNLGWLDSLTCTEEAWFWLSCLVSCAEALWCCELWRWSSSWPLAAKLTSHTAHLKGRASFFGTSFLMIGDVSVTLSKLGATTGEEDWNR